MVASAEKYSYNMDKAKESLAELGITVNIEQVAKDENVAMQFGSKLDKDGMRTYDMIFCEWACDFPDPAAILSPIFNSANKGEGAATALPTAMIRWMHC